MEQGSKPVPAWDQAASLSAVLAWEKLDQAWTRNTQKITGNQRWQKGHVVKRLVLVARPEKAVTSGANLHL